MTRPRLSFLPTFFIALLIVFTIAAAVRIRSYHVGNVLQRISSEEGQAQQPDARLANASRDSVLPALDTQNDSRNTTSARGETAADQRRIAEREQRYNELLKSPPAGAAITQQHPSNASGAGASPVPRPVPPAPQPGILSRIVSPIVKAITGGNNTTSKRSATPRNDTTTQPDKPRHREPKDPNSDVTPPTLGTIELS